MMGFHRPFAGADLIRFVSFETMRAKPVFLRINSHSAQAELIGGAKDANGDFAAIGGEEFADRIGFLHLRGDQGVARNSTLFHAENATRAQFFRFREPIPFLRRKRRSPGASLTYGVVGASGMPC